MAKCKALTRSVVKGLVTSLSGGETRSTIRHLRYTLFILSASQMTKISFDWQSDWECRRRHGHGKSITASANRLLCRLGP